MQDSEQVNYSTSQLDDCRT